MSWPLAKLGEIAPSKPIRANGYSADNLVWQITLDHVEANTGVLLKKSIRPYSEAGSSTHGFDDRYVLYSKLRPYLNKVLLPDEEGVCTTELVPMLPNQKTLDRNYLAHYLKSREFVNWISAQTAGAKMPRVSMDVFWDHEIPLPPLEEQKRIAAILDKADAIRRKRQQAIKLADDFLRSVFLEMFGDLFCDAGYQAALKKSIAELTNYIDYRGKTPEKSDFGIPLITAKNVRMGYVSEEPKEFIPADSYESWMTRGLPSENDVLFTTEAPLGNVALLGKYERVALGQRLISLRSKGEITQEYLLFALLNPFIQGLIDSKSSGSTAKGIRTKELYQIEIPIPDLNMQRKFSEVYRKSVLSKLRHGSAHENIKTLFESLSQKAFSGTI